MEEIRKYHNEDKMKWLTEEFHHNEDKMEWLTEEFPNVDEIILEDILFNEADGDIFDALDLLEELYPHVKKKNIKNTPPKIVKDAIEYFKTKPKSECSRINVWNWVFDRVDKNSGYPPNKFQFDKWYRHITLNILSTSEFKDWCDQLYEEWYPSHKK